MASSFSPFTRLPIELRFMIYSLTLEPRVIRLDISWNSYHTRAQDIDVLDYTPPPLLSVSRETRAFALTKYKSYPVPSDPESEYYSNVDLDLYHFSWKNEFMWHALHHVKHVLWTPLSLCDYLENLSDLSHEDGNDNLRDVCPNVETVCVLMSRVIGSNERFLNIDTVVPFPPESGYAWHEEDFGPLSTDHSKEYEQFWTEAWTQFGEFPPAIKLEFVSPPEGWEKQKALTSYGNWFFRPIQKASSNE